MTAGLAAAQAPQAAQSEAARTTTPAASLPSDYVIGVEDVLSVVFWREKEMSADVIVRPDGKISLPMLNDVAAAGLTPKRWPRSWQGRHEVRSRRRRDRDRQGDSQPQGLHHRRGVQARDVPTRERDDRPAGDRRGRRVYRGRQQERRRDCPQRRRHGAPLQVQLQRRRQRQEPGSRTSGCFPATPSSFASVSTTVTTPLCSSAICVIVAACMVFVGVLPALAQGAAASRRRPAVCSARRGRTWVAATN